MVCLAAEECSGAVLACVVQCPSSFESMFSRRKVHHIVEELFAVKILQELGYSLFVVVCFLHFHRFEFHIVRLMEWFDWFAVASEFFFFFLLCISFLTAAEKSLASTNTAPSGQCIFKAVMEHKTRK